MEKAVASGFAKTLRQNMEHQQVEEIFSGYSPGTIFPAFGMDIAEGDHAVLAAEDVLFLNDTFIQIFAKVNDRFVAAAYFLAVDHPVFRGVGWYPEIVVNDCLQELCPENLCQSFEEYEGI